MNEHLVFRDLPCFMAVLLAAVLLGCGKEAESEPSEPDRIAVPIPATNANKPMVVIENSDPAQIAAVLLELTQAVRKYGLEQRQRPKSLNDLVIKGYLPELPKAPAGKRFEINKNLEVYLAD